MTSTKLFRPLPEVHRTDQSDERLRPHLTSWGRLNAVLKADKISTPELQLLLLMEADKPEPRYVIVRKLVARILSRERARMVKEAYGKLTP